ncbi:type II toxin-antitoxin system VapC family toxin [Cyanobium sp. FGCU-52]|nr:type II toxin-antitoxin system VapC family toxin [Cyanobium sp. FGCU52]
MILYCDTSALIKLLVQEPGSDRLQRVSSEAEAIAVCRVTWAEAMAAMARRQREDPLSSSDLEQARQLLIRTWAQFLIVEISQRLVESAGRYADAFALRGYDSVQLAAAHELHRSTALPITFACSDRRLNQAAQLLQLGVLA